VTTVLGIGLSSNATADEVAALASAVLAAADRRLADVRVVATRSRFVGDTRLALGPPVVGFEDDVLVRASERPSRAVGIPARVAETAARLAASGAPVIERVARSAHVTVALVDDVEATRRRSR
jgi:hypothetical protein